MTNENKSLEPIAEVCIPGKIATNIGTGGRMRFVSTVYSTHPLEEGAKLYSEAQPEPEVVDLLLKAEADFNRKTNDLIKRHSEQIEFLKSKLAEQDSDPVAWMWENDDKTALCVDWHRSELHTIPLYTAPQPQPKQDSEPNGHMHQLVDHDGKPKGVWLAVFGKNSKEICQIAHTPGETCDEILPFYTAPQHKPLTLRYDLLHEYASNHRLSYNELCEVVRQSVLAAAPAVQPDGDER